MLTLEARGTDKIIVGLLGSNDKAELSPDEFVMYSNTHAQIFPLSLIQWIDPENAPPDGSYVEDAFLDERNPDPVDVILNHPGKFMKVTFIKRTNGEIREMLCQYRPKSEELATNDPKKHELILVWDLQKKAFRSIPKEGVLSVKFKGKEYGS